MPDAPKRITVIGLGLIGGSLGLALKAAGLDDVEIVGHDVSRGAANAAAKRGAVDKAEHNLRRAVQGASMVVVATPVLAIREVFEQIAADLVEGCVVTDTGSTKERVMEWAAELLPKHVSFVGGHPLAGKEEQGIDSADADLFRGRAYAVCPAVDAHEDAVRAVVGLIRLVGAEPLFLEPQEHDQYAAAVSHLPLVLSSALFTLARSSPGWEDIAPLASSGFRDLTRLASGDPQMGHDIFLTNREAAVHWIDRMVEELRRYRDLLESDTEGLLEALARAKMDRDDFLARPTPKRQEPQAPDVRQDLVNALVGSWVADRMKKVRDLPKVAREGAPTRAQRVAEDIRRDLEKLEEKRKAREAKD
jgi:prephenate dehydrogenase